MRSPGTHCAAWRRPGELVDRRVSLLGSKTALFVLIAPLLGSLLGFSLMKLVTVLFGARSHHGIARISRRLQLVSAALYSLGHGGNDAQKTMGIIVAALVANSWSPRRGARRNTCPSGS